jgi:hypothetical protein
LIPGRSEEIAGGEMANFQTPAQEFALRAFPHSRRAQQNEPPSAMAFPWGRRAIRRRTFQPSGAVNFVFCVHSAGSLAADMHLLFMAAKWEGPEG